MNGQIFIETPRLILRDYRISDQEAFYELNSSEKVMEYFVTPLDLNQSNHVMEKLSEKICTHGFGFWAVELKETGQMIGFVGLNRPLYELPMKDSTEIGWRLKEDFWGEGYAPEAARACLDFAFDELKLEQVIAFTPIKNSKSRRVMEKLGMVNMELNFMHPMVDQDSPICEHVLYGTTSKKIVFSEF